MKNILVILGCLLLLIGTGHSLVAQVDTTKVVQVTPEENRLNGAFRKIRPEETVGSMTQLSGDEIRKYDNTIWVSNVLAGRATGMIGGNNIRGVGIGIEVGDITGSGLFSGNAMFVVDGLPRDIEGLRLSEIESITVLKDVNAALLYGSAAVNGVVLISTKRGKANVTTSNVTLNYGLSSPRSFPKYLNSADYMTYFNQARANDGLSPQFSDETIQNYRTGNKYRYPSMDYYSSEYLRNFKNYHDVNAEFSGGDENARFYTNVGWNSNGSLLGFGEGRKARDNMFNVRGNVDLRVNSRIKTSVDAVAMYGSDARPRGNYWGSSLSLRPNEYSPLLPISMIDPEIPLLNSRRNDIDGQFLIGGNASNINTPLGDGYAAGTIQTIVRKFTFNNRIDFDLNDVTPGLSAHTNISFDYLTGYLQTVANQYSVYTPTWAENEDRIIALQQHGRDTRPGTRVVSEGIFRRRLGFFGQLAYDRTVKEKHHFTANVIGFGSIYKEINDFQGVKNVHLGVQAAYAFDGRYVVDFSGAYINSVKLPENNRRSFSPSLGLSWMLSKEAFLSSISQIDHLKLRLSGGMLKTDLPIGGFFYYDNRYSASGTYNWYEGTRSRSGVISNWSSNRQLDFARRNEVNLGLDGLFFNKTLGLEANLFYNIYDRFVVRPATQYPSFYTDFIAYENFEADKYKGAELGLTFNKTRGDWQFFAGLNLLYVTSKRTRVDEVYDNAYQNREGRPKDATFGLESVGFFKDQADIDNSPIQTFGTVRPGDLKYKDQNGDGIVNANDEVYLRRWQAPFTGGLQLRVSYKNLSLYLLGEGRAGAKTFREGNYHWIDGNKKYTEVVLNAWTPETAETATYPRLSSQTNSNNFRRSSFWLYSDDYFQLRRTQLTYSVPEYLSRKLLMSGADIFVNTSDLFQLAKNRDLRELRAGVEPLYRTFTLGLKANF